MGAAKTVTIRRKRRQWFVSKVCVVSLVCERRFLTPITVDNLSWRVAPSLRDGARYLRDDGVWNTPQQTSTSHWPVHHTATSTSHWPVHHTTTNT